jgi:hypothetical protein
MADDGEVLALFDRLSVKIARVYVQSNRRSSVMSVQVTPLRQRMIDDMAIRNMSPLTKKS